MNRCHAYESGDAPARLITEDFCRLPLDLRERVEPVRLMRWIHEAALELDWRNPLVVDYLRRCPEDRPQMMLTLLAYVFLTRAGGAEEIASACRSERELHLLCEGSPPFSTEITAFRRKNRRLLQFVLERVILRTVVEVSEVGFMEVANTAENAKRQASERLDLARHMDSGE